MELQKVFEYAITKEVEENLLTRKSKKLKASDLKPYEREFKVNVTLDVARRKMQVEITYGGVIIYKDWLPVYELFNNTHVIDDIAYNLRRMKQSYTIDNNTNNSCEEDYEQEEE